MGNRSVQTSTKEIALPREHLALKVCINVPKSHVMADLAGCLIMGHTTVEIPDGAPMMMRQHRLEKAEAAKVVKLVTNTRRQPGLSQ